MPLRTTEWIAEKVLCDETVNVVVASVVDCTHCREHIICMLWRLDYLLCGLCCFVSPLALKRVFLLSVVCGLNPLF